MQPQGKCLAGTMEQDAGIGVADTEDLRDLDQRMSQAPQLDGRPLGNGEFRERRRDGIFKLAPHRFVEGSGGAEIRQRQRGTVGGRVFEADGGRTPLSPVDAGIGDCLVE